MAFRIAYHLLILTGVLLGTVFFLAFIAFFVASVSTSSSMPDSWYELVPLQNSAKSFFGFSDFISALALLVVIYTMTDPKYRFRIKLLPSKARFFAFVSIGIIALLSLLCDYLFLDSALTLPRFISNRLNWELALAVGSLFLIFLWVWYAFISPPRLNRHSSARFHFVARETIINGNVQQMEILAEELTDSLSNLVKDCYGIKELNKVEAGKEGAHRINCYWLFRLLSTPRFCRVLALNKPHTLITLLQEIVVQERFDLGVDDLSANVTIELINNKGSLLYEENRRFDRTYLGQTRFLTRFLFRELVDHNRFRSPLTLSLWEHSHWSNDHLELYLECAIEYAKYSIEKKTISYDRVVRSLIDELKDSWSDFHSDRYMIDHQYQETMDRALSIQMKFIDDLLSLMDKKCPEIAASVPHKYEKTNFDYSIHYEIAQFIYWKMRHTGLANKLGVDHQWGLCYVTVWRVFTNRKIGPHRNLVAKNLRRIIYQEINDQIMFPSYVIAPVVGFCLNVCGLKTGRDHSKKLTHNTIIRYIVLPFIQKNFRSLYKTHTKVTKTMLQGGVIYDESRNQIIKEFRESLDGTKSRQVLELVGSPRGRFY